MSVRTGRSASCVARILTLALLTGLLGGLVAGRAAGGTPGIQVAATTLPMTNAAATTTNAVVACPAGSVVTGGGIALGRADPTDPTIPANGLKVNSSMPSDTSGNVTPSGTIDPAVWTAVGAFGGQSEPGDAVTGFAMCAGGGLQTAVVTASVTSVTTQANPALVATATCPTGTRLVGGGMFGANVNPSFKPIASYPSDVSGTASVNGDFDPTSWSAYGGAGQLMTGEVTTAFALCATSPSINVQVARVDGQAPGPDGSSVTLTATCDPGTNLLSGGAAADNAGDFTNPQQGVHLRGSYPSDAAGHPVGSGGPAPGSWSSIEQIGGQETTAGAHAFALCATAATSASADISLAASGTDPSSVGGALIYTFTVSDAGPNAATGVAVSDPLPPSVTFRSGAGCTPASGTVTCLLGQVARGATATATIVVTPNASGPLTNTASVSANETDPDPANNTAFITTTVVPGSEAADVSVVNSAPRGVASSGVLTYALTVANAGPATATGVSLTDVLDPLVTFNSLTTSQGSCTQASGTITCAIGELAAGATGTVAVATTAPPQINETIVTSTARVSADQADPNPFNHTASAVTVVGLADLSAALSGDQNPAVANGILTYTATVRDNGPALAHHVVYADQMPDGATLLSAGFVPGAGTGTCSQIPNSQTVSCVPRGGAMGSGQTDAVAISVRLGAATGVVTGSVSVSADEVDPNPANNTASVTTTVVAQGAEVSLTEAIVPNRIFVTTSSFTITATIANAGTLDATNLIFRHVQPVPRVVKLLSFTPSQGSCVEGANPFFNTGFEVTCTVGTLPAGTTATVSLVYAPISATNFQGTDNVSADQPDPNLSNNSFVDALVIQKANPTVTTTASAQVAVGGSIFDTATINNGYGLPTFPPHGSLVFTLFGPGDTTCGGPTVFTSMIRLPGTVLAYAGYPSPVTATSAAFRTSTSGTYRWVARYLGDGNNNPTSTACNDPGGSVVVSQASPAIASQASPTVPVGGVITDTATLSEGFNPTGAVTFSIYGPADATCSQSPAATTTATVGGNGTYTSGPFTPVHSGTYLFVASYSGDAHNHPVSGTCNDAGESVVVTPAPTTVTLASSASPSAFGSPVTFTASVSADPATAGIPGGSVTFTANGTTLGVVSVTAGRASLSTAALPPGPVSVTASYGGTSDFLASSATMTQVIGCPTTQTGLFPTGLVVNGPVCISSAVVLGPVMITAGGSLAATNTSFGSPISVSPGGALAVSGGGVTGTITSSGSTGLRICAAEVSGPVSLLASTGAVVIGDAADDISPSCGPNTISGPVKVSGSRAGAELSGNTISGGVTLTGNAGSSPGADQAGVEVESNHVNGQLSCSANSAVSDDGSPNTVTGPASGQCAALGH